MKIILTLLTILAACTTGDPESRGIEVNYDIYKVYNQDKAMLVAERMVEEHYNIWLDNIFERTTVYWSDTMCPYQDSYAVVHKNKCYYGKMWSCDEMYVALSNADENTTCGSALLHEFGHCMHMRAGWDGDSDHNDGEFWAVISEAREFSCGRGW